MMKKHKNVKLTALEESRVLRDASEMLGGFYRFNGVWDMEPCPEPVDNHDLRWDVKYRDDPEWAFMFVRMDYLYKLRLAAEISGDERYARHGIKIIGKWWRDNHKFINGLFGRASRKLFRNSLGYRTLDMAIMISNVADYTRWCQENGLIDKRQEKTCTKRIRRIIAHLNKQTNPDFKDFSNWGLLESGNMAYTMLRLGITNHYSEVRDRLVRQAHNQINANGSHVESSPMYLVQCLWILLRVLSLPECDCRRSLRPPVMAGCRYIAGIRGPDNCIPNLGDSDVTDISDLMIVAGKTLGTDEFDGFVSRVLDPEYAVKFNMERGQEILEGAKAGQKETQASRHPSLIEYPYQTVYRSGDAWLLCSNIPRAGYGHKHCDYLSLLYALNGKDVLVDLGRPSYRDDESRCFHKGPWGHNTVSIAGDKGEPVFWKYVTGWQTDEQVECRENRVICRNDSITVIMRCIFGYADAEITRYVSCVTGVGLFITDRQPGEKIRKTETYFNLAPGFRVDGRTASDEERTIYYSNDLGIEQTVRPVMYSRRYNEQEQTSQIVVFAQTEWLTHALLMTDKKWSVNYGDTGIRYSINGTGLVIPVEGGDYSGIE